MDHDFDTARLDHVARRLPMTALHDARPRLPAGLLEHVLDHIDYGIACLDDCGRLLHANRAASECWTRVHTEREPLRGAIQAAAGRGVRRLVEVGEGAGRFTVAVVPLADAGGAGHQVLLVLGKRSVCEQLSSYWYGVARGLTGAEQAVLEEIAAGCSPRDIAARRRVSLATVRSHITALRGKTGTSNLYALLREMAQLPPIRSARLDDSTG